ncbi:MAG TPA: ABC transporter permease [Gammaproteobacteria bacterium]|nr:ABC transporter permease [Gammaproteobacteria bacterium]
MVESRDLAVRDSGGRAGAVLNHYLSLALRNLRRSPVAAAVNVVTLALGLACFVGAYAFVTFWQRSEQHFANADRIAVLTTNVEVLDGSLSVADDTSTSVHAAKYLRAEYPAIERVARAIKLGDDATLAAGDRAVRAKAAAVDAEFLDVFDLPFVAGDAHLALGQPRSAVVTQDLAHRLFGDADPLGRAVIVQNAAEAVVTGVVGPIPEPSHLGRSAAAALPFDLLVSADVRDTIRAAARPPGAPPEDVESWLGESAITYLLLPADGSLTFERLRAELATFAARHVPAEVARFAKIGFSAIPVRDVLGNAVDGQIFVLGGSTLSVGAMLLTLGVLVLAVACVNYANLATARAARRVREVGVRKALGAQPRQVMLQHLLEAAVLTAIALAVALVVCRLLAPPMERLVNADLGAIVAATPEFWLTIAAVAVAATVAAGAYPAFVLARVLPMRALRVSRSQLGPKALATLLVGSQFAVASFLLIAVTIAWLQNRHLLRTGLDTRSDPLVLIENDSRVTHVSTATLREELARVPQVQAVTEVGVTPWQGFMVMGISTSPGMDAITKSVLSTGVGHDFFSVFEMPVLAGRTFSPEHAATDFQNREGQAVQAIVVDRAFAEAFGFASPESAVDQIVYVPARTMAAFGETAQPFRIIGVVETRPFNFLGPKDVRASIYQLWTDSRFHVARIAKSDVAGSLEGIDAAWRRLAPNVAISRRFLNDVFDKEYSTFARSANMFGGLAAMALLISVSGLFGMATLVAGRRLPEIGVRKSFGASAAQVMGLLLRSFSMPVVIANLIAWPAAYLAARAYLHLLRAPIVLTIWPFAASLLVTLAIACIAVGGQTVRAARAKPADVLRYE